jgi:CO/xanthine dehydrogenase Mo-binding subunit
MTARKTSIVGSARPVSTLEKVTGAAQYVDDIQFGPNLLHAKLKRSTIPHGRIVRLDIRKASALPGVRVVVTGHDFPGYTGLYLRDRRIFALDRVRFVGEPVAAVAADSEELASRAVELIEVEYEVAGVFDRVWGERGGAAGAPGPGRIRVRRSSFPRRHEHLQLVQSERECGTGPCGGRPGVRTSLPGACIQHVPLEPHVCVAQQDVNGKITLWSASQSPFAQRNLIAHALGFGHSKLRVITPHVGGGFGSKAGVSIEGAAVALAMLAKGRPVKLRMTREEEFYTTFVRQGLVGYVKMGMARDGRLTAVQNRFYWDGGAYTEYGVNIARAAGYSGTGPYFVPHIHIDSLCVYTNHPIGGPMRGFGMAEIHWGIEQHIDQMAHRLGLDPVQVRLLNCLKDGQETHRHAHARDLVERMHPARRGCHWVGSAGHSVE